MVEARRLTTATSGIAYDPIKVCAASAKVPVATLIVSSQRDLTRRRGGRGVWRPFDVAQDMLCGKSSDFFKVSPGSQRKFFAFGQLRQATPGQ